LLDNGAEKAYSGHRRRNNGVSVGRVAEKGGAEVGRQRGPGETRGECVGAAAASATGSHAEGVENQMVAIEANRPDTHTHKDD